MSIRDEFFSNDRVTDFSTVKYESPKNTEDDFFSKRDFVIKPAVKPTAKKSPTSPSLKTPTPLVSKTSTNATKENSSTPDTIPPKTSTPSSPEKSENPKNPKPTKKPEPSPAETTSEASPQTPQKISEKPSLSPSKNSSPQTLKTPENPQIPSPAKNPSPDPSTDLPQPLFPKKAKKPKNSKNPLKLLKSSSQNPPEIKNSQKTKEKPPKTPSTPKPEISPTPSTPKPETPPKSKSTPKKTKVQKSQSIKSTPPPEPRPALSRGGKNLLRLGVGAIIIAMSTTILSLVLYHNSGDIYLDRSRPGYLPEKAEATLEEQYAFPDSGTIDNEVLDDYLKNLRKERKTIEGLDNPYGAAPLSDESLGIPTPLDPEP